MSHLYPTLGHDPARDLVELASDVEATWPSRDPALAREAWISRPAILRRVADRIAREIPSGCDLIVATGHHAEAMGAAVGLASGIRWTLGHSHSSRASRRSTIIAVDAASAAELAGDPSARISVVGAVPGVISLLGATPPDPEENS